MMKMMDSSYKDTYPFLWGYRRGLFLFSRFLVFTLMLGFALNSALN